MISHNSPSANSPMTSERGKNPLMASADWMSLTSSRTVALKRVRFLAFVGALVGEFGRMGEVC